MSTQNVEYKLDTLDEIVFERRNKAYGAYDLRITYKRLLTKALLVGTAIFIALIAGPFIYLKVKAAKNAKEEVHIGVDLTTIEDTAPEKEKEKPEEEKPQLLAKTEPIQQATVQDLLPDPVKNPPVETPPASTKEVENTATGTKTQEGEHNSGYQAAGSTQGTHAGTTEGTGTKPATPTPPTNEIVKDPDVEPEYPGGIGKFRTLVMDYFSDVSIDGEGSMKAKVTFVVEKDGSITGVKASGSNPDFNKEAEKAVRSIKTKWTPGKNGGQPVRTYYNIPVTMTFE